MLNEILFLTTTYTGNQVLYLCGIYSVHPIIASGVGVSVLSYTTLKSVPFVTRHCLKYIKKMY
jgi:hypothetical protein